MPHDPADRKLADEDRVAIPLDPETALRALLAVNLDAPPVSEDRDAVDDSDTPSRPQP